MWQSEHSMTLMSEAMFLLSVISRIITQTHGTTLLPYGPTVDQSQFVDDFDEVTVPLTVALPFFGTTYTTAYLIDSGKIFFESGQGDHYSDPFPDNRSIIAPLWSDMLETTEPLYWRQTTTNITDLQTASNYVRQIYPAFSTFQATWVMVVTWDRFLKYTETSGLENTFQAILATDGTYSFAISLYDVIQSLAVTTIGVNAGDNVNYYMLCVSRTEDVLNIKELAMTPCGEPGLIVFRMDAINPDQGTYNCTPTYPACGTQTYECYPNGTIKVTHPAYSHVLAVQNEGLPSAVKCTVATSGSSSLITGCSQDTAIVAFFSNRSGDKVTFGTSDYLSIEIQCNDIIESGVLRTVSDQLDVDLEFTTQDAVTPSFTITSALRDPDQLGSPVYAQVVGEEIYWTIDIPSDYSASPTCYAYSGTTETGSPSTLLVLDGCSQDSSILGGDFDNVETSIPLIKRYYVSLYVFKFYNSDDVFFKCTVKVCPSGSTACDITCAKRKRSIEAVGPQRPDEHVFTTSNLIHVLPHGNGASSVLGCVWLWVAAVLTSF